MLHYVEDALGAMAVERSSPGLGLVALPAFIGTTT